MKVIGLCGYAGSGKDYVYKKLDAFLATRQETTLRVALADEVRHEVEAIVGGGSYLPTVWEKPYPDEIRRLLQWWGTDLRRAADEDYWTFKTHGTIEDIEREGDTDVVIVTDVRFANEADMIRSLGGIVVQVLATGEKRAERLGGSLPPEHASEVIDFATDAAIWNHTGPVLSGTVARYLGLASTCAKCRTLYGEHPWHDDGTSGDL